MPSAPLTRNMQRRDLRLKWDIWSVLSVIIALIVLAPICSVAYLALFPTENIWPHLLSTTLPRYLKNTLILMIGVGTLTAMVGTGAAYLICRFRFIGSRWLEWALLLPLAVPAYIGAYALVDLLEYAGPVQTHLRAVFGWESAKDYWFPEIRSMGAAIVVLTGSLFPYVYLLTRAALKEQSSSADEVAQSLGQGALARFFKVALPMARPAIVAGVAIVMMETVNDFGTVDFFAVQTLTTGIFGVWLETHNAGGAGQLACVILTMIVLLVVLEKYSRRRLKFFNPGKWNRPLAKKTLSPMMSLTAFVLCMIPFFIGFIVPFGTILSHALDNVSAWWSVDLLRAAKNTLMVGSIAALITVTAGVFMVYGVRTSQARLPQLLLPITTIGYAAPGAVLGVGLLIPLAAIDNSIADTIWATTGYDPGLMMTGTAFAIILAFCVRFFAIAQGAADAALGRISPNLELAARSLGKTQGQALREVYYPLMKGSLGSALLLVFVDSVKELPATLLLRPFNFETLATRAHEQASLENLGQAAPAAILVIFVGLVAVSLLARANR